ncbi:hypothetical protein [Parvicella tangerina]|uniref:DUF3575 domain-containing protein n=1 Tax=Parvicella tangerina TaxID=2829795 RepID=A0A916NBB2_9FLAO|nr:hypothetical protein [Parvicella tangerina]CAG5080545.1 hypothetical protein CRYO30217_01367 [Parvicella tangerina]
MKVLYTLIFVLSVAAIQAQDTLSECYAKTRGSKSISLSYFGEMITHPGLKIGYNHQLHLKIHHKKRKSEKMDEYIYVRRSYLLGISAGGFNHNRYQSGYFTVLEPKYRVESKSGLFYEMGLGGGYMKTLTPSIYVENGDLKEKYFHNDYFITSISASIGRNMSLSRNVPLEWLIKPQFIYALPNFPKGVGYFVLEIGVSYNLKALL